MSAVVLRMSGNEAGRKYINVSIYFGSVAEANAGTHISHWRGTGFHLDLMVKLLVDCE